ncbi:serine/arginine repetitive matrix protein 1-like [Schistocerca serialis cubense]|uniref:serine/arginine repetitive matrix protein 1-like n=1 Tax=Schistocerca serialis cubense TaxID=2023355 RepID=UPI00214F3CDE|nr:serine/arginine repetitive matrix protein 1-like [Schistocerca serialis cubense]
MTERRTRQAAAAHRLPPCGAPVSSLLERRGIQPTRRAASPTGYIAAAPRRVGGDAAQRGCRRRASAPSVREPLSGRAGAPAGLPLARLAVLRRGRCCEADRDATPGRTLPRRAARPKNTDVRAWRSALRYAAPPVGRFPRPSPPPRRPTGGAGAPPPTPRRPPTFAPERKKHFLLQASQSRVRPKSTGLYPKHSRDFAQATTLTDERSSVPRGRQG